MELSKEIKRNLNKYGWSDERKVDIEKYRLFLEKEGYQVFESALKFLSSFADVCLEIPLNRDKVHFDPIKATGGIFIENVQFYEKRINERLVPIGENSYHYTLLISQSGKIYAGFDDLLFLLGNDYKTAIEHLYYGLGKIQIP